MAMKHRIARLVADGQAHRIGKQDGVRADLFAQHGTFAVAVGELDIRPVQHVGGHAAEQGADVLADEPDAARLLFRDHEHAVGLHETRHVNRCLVVFVLYGWPIA